MSAADFVDWPTDELVAGVIIGEAAGEPPDGQAAIACVISNRSRIAADFYRRTGKRYWWANTDNAPATDFVRGVILKPWQFSCIDDSVARITSAMRTNSPSFLTGLSVARRMLAGELHDVTCGADHYYATSIAAPAWARGKTPIASIGLHRFFKLTA